MEVRDVEDQLWTLLKRNGTLFLDVSCEHSAAGYNVLIELDASERLAYAKLGRSYLSELAERINYSAPGALGHTSPYTSRNVANVYSNEVVAVFKLGVPTNVLPPNYSFQRTPVHRLRFVQALRRRRR